ncbi:MAG: NAD(P)H-binding protein [Bacteroidetes bacterium]|nr:NAD(P)H-binding protein [Bacteroidota bacterium]
MKIIVTGSLGHIGRPLTAVLLQQGHAVTVISSNAEKQNEIEAIGAKAAIGSIEDDEFLADVCHGADALFAMVPPKYSEPDPQAYYKRIAGHYSQVIQRSGLRRVVYLSSIGAHLERNNGFIVGSYLSEAILNKLPGVAITHLRPGYFYYNLLHFAGMLKHAGIIGSNYGGNDKLVLVAPEDIAVAAAEELVSPGRGIDVRYVASDERTANEVARVLGAAVDKKDLEWLLFTDEQVINSMLEQAVPAHVARNTAEIGANLHNGRMREDYELHRPVVFGKIKLEDFAAEFAEAYNRLH